MVGDTGPCPMQKGTIVMSRDRVKTLVRTHLLRYKMEYLPHAPISARWCFIKCPAWCISIHGRRHMRTCRNRVFNGTVTKGLMYLLYAAESVYYSIFVA